MKKINGISVYNYGNENNQSVVFVHGFPFDNSMWDKQVKALKDNYHVITIDLRGFNNSEVGDGQYTMEMFVDDLHNVIMELNLSKPVICGLSMGGYITFRYAEKYGNVKALVFSDTKAHSDPDSVKLNRSAGIKKINEYGVAPFVSEFIPNTLAEKNKSNNHILDPLVIKAKTISPKTLKGALIAMAMRTDTTAYLSKIDYPVLYICGEEDKLTPVDTMRELSNLTPGSLFEMIEEAGHLAPVENPERFNTVLENFLGGLE